MKIAYLITAYNNYDHLYKLINALDDKDVMFFIHVDKKVNMPNKLFLNNNIIFIKRTKVSWGGWSHLEAILNLIREAISYDANYYVLLSGTDYPIRPNSFLYSKLKEGGEFINIIQGFQNHKPESRIKYYHYDTFDRRNKKNFKTKFFLELENFQRKLFVKKTYPFKAIFHGSTWWALSHECIIYIMQYLKDNPEYIKFYKSSWCPEESFMQTIIGNSPFLNRCKTNLTFTDWSTNPAPAVISEKHIKLFKNQTEFNGTYGEYTPFFARKFNDSSDNLISIIDEELRI